MREVEIRDDTIRLGQLLKLAGIVDSGGEAKALIAEGGVTVNGEPESRRGRQLRAGDMLVAAGQEVRVV
jgi:ribosome-associated protein